MPCSSVPSLLGASSSRLRHKKSGDLGLAGVRRCWHTDSCLLWLVNLLDDAIGCCEHVPCFLVRSEVGLAKFCGRELSSLVDRRSRVHIDLWDREPSESPSALGLAERNG